MTDGQTELPLAHVCGVIMLTQTLPFVHAHRVMMFIQNIIESVDSISRDGPDMP